MHCKSKVLEINYQDIIQNFLDHGKGVAFIPNDQTDTDRYHWHLTSEKLDVQHKTLKLWTNISLCGAHDKPIRRPKNYEFGRGYDSDYECDYECGSDEECYSNCCYRDTTYLCKMRTVVIFNKEGADAIQDMNVEKIKEYLVTKDIIKVVNNKYTL